MTIIEIFHQFDLIDHMLSIYIVIQKKSSLCDL